MDDFKKKFAQLFNKSSPQMEFTFAGQLLSLRFWDAALGKRLASR
jgi:hypothetical protein